MPSSVPVTPAVCAKTPTIAATVSAFTPSDTPNARSRFPAPRACTSVAMLAIQSRKRGWMRAARPDDADRSLGHSAEDRDDRAAYPAKAAREETRDLVGFDVRLPMSEHLGP